MSLKTTSLFLGFLTIPFYCFAGDFLSIDLGFIVQIIELFVDILFVCSVICIIHFFWPGKKSMYRFHVFNAVFVVVFYCISLRFLITHKSYFEGYATLSDIQCIKKYFLPTDTWLIIRKLIVVAFVLNIIYIVRHRKTFYINTVR